ncbi:NAD(P)H-dependent oxidoreductase [Streptomyces sp. NPDC051020]|uniref:NAD(P)H-dependent oxidoreductase n=1 Tax=Streptomyces sp. NPDC051020 TaxID=3155409 RepID=UPI0034161AF7
MLAERLAEAAVEELHSRSASAQARFIEVQEHGQTLIGTLVTGRLVGPLRAALATVAEADAPIAVTPTYSVAYPNTFKAFFDAISAWDVEAVADMPVLLAAPGATARHALMLDPGLRPVFTRLHANVLPTAVFPELGDWVSASPTLSGRGDRAVGELAGGRCSASQRLTSLRLRRSGRRVVLPALCCRVSERPDRCPGQLPLLTVLVGQSVLRASGASAIGEQTQL